MSAVDELLDLARQLKERNADGGALQMLLGEINVALGDILACMEKPDDDTRAAQIIAQAIGNLRLTAPEVVVNVPPAPTPVVNVAGPEVKVLPASLPSPTSWTLTVRERDGNGAIRSISITPET